MDKEYIHKLMVNLASCRYVIAFFANALRRLRPLTQDEMKHLFVDKFKHSGTRVKKDGKWRLSRPARIGEVVLTVIDGELMARNVTGFRV